MRIGYCCNMLATSSDPCGFEALEQILDAGFDYVEVPIAQIMDLPYRIFDSWVNYLRAIGLPCEACNNFFPAKIRITGENIDKQLVLYYIHMALDRAHRLGASVIVFGSSAAKNIPDMFSYHRAWDQLITLLQDISTLAEPYGIYIGIEPLCKQESNIVNNLHEGLKLLRNVNRNNICLTLDYFHFIKENDVLHDLLQLKKEMVHVHFSEPNGRIYPQKNKITTYTEFFSILHQIEYDKRISLEAYPGSKENDLGSAAALMRLSMAKADL